MNTLRTWIVLTLGALTSVAHGMNATLPTLFVAGDSTAAKSPVAQQEGWGEPLLYYFDSAKMNVVNLAYGGRSSRTFVTQGHWDQVLAQLKAGDYVLLQFGHNDAGALNEEAPGSNRPLRARGTIPGLGEETQEIDNVITGKHEVVHSFGWYLRKMINEVKAKGATPIVLSLTGRNIWKDGRVECGSGNYREWDAAVAHHENVAFIDLTRIIADRFQTLGSDAVKKFYSIDYLHTNLEGSFFNAAAVVSGLRTLNFQPIESALSATGRAVAADPGMGPASVCTPLTAF